MDEQFDLRVPPSVADHIERLLGENASSDTDKSLDLSFSEDGRSVTFVIGNDSFPASLLDLPTILESYKTYDDNNLIKTADVGQMIVVGEQSDPPLNVAECLHGLTPPLRDARRRRFRREPDLNPEFVQRVEQDLLNIMNGGTAENLDMDMDMTEQIEIGDVSACNTMKKAASASAAKHDVIVAGINVREPERSDSDESDFDI